MAIYFYDWALCAPRKTDCRRTERLNRKGIYGCRNLCHRPTMRGRERIRFYFLGFLVSFATKAFPFLWRFPYRRRRCVIICSAECTVSSAANVCTHIIIRDAAQIKAHALNKTTHTRALAEGDFSIKTENCHRISLSLVNKNARNIC
jgi:hypothetical protein